MVPRRRLLASSATGQRPGDPAGQPPPPGGDGPRSGARPAQRARHGGARRARAGRRRRRTCRWCARAAPPGRERRGGRTGRPRRGRERARLPRSGLAGGPGLSGARGGAPARGAGLHQPLLPARSRAPRRRPLRDGLPRAAQSPGWGDRGPGGQPLACHAHRLPRRAGAHRRAGFPGVRPEPAGTRHLWGDQGGRTAHRSGRLADSPPASAAVREARPLPAGVPGHRRRPVQLQPGVRPGHVGGGARGVSPRGVPGGGPRPTGQAVLPAGRRDRGQRLERVRGGRPALRPK